MHMGKAMQNSAKAAGLFILENFTQKTVTSSRVWPPPSAHRLFPAAEVLGGVEVRL